MNVPVLLHLGFKWDPGNPGKQSFTRYTWHPRLSCPEITGKLREITGAKQGTAIDQAARQHLSMARTKIPDRDILFFEAAEEPPPRWSVDINVYRANLQVAVSNP